METKLSEIPRLKDGAQPASDFLKAMSNPYRLQVLCQLGEGELSVGSLQERVGLSQSALSQHLSRLKEAALVASRRDGQTMYYRLADSTAVSIIRLLAQRFCPEVTS